MFSSALWTSVLERALKTIAQSLLAVWAVGGGLDLLHVDWRSALSISLGAGLLSVLTSLASIQVPPYSLGGTAGGGKHESAP